MHAQGTELMLEETVTQDAQPATYRMFSGPSPYVPQTPWGPWAAGFAKVGLLLFEALPIVLLANVSIRLKYTNGEQSWIFLLIGIAWLVAAEFSSFPRRVLAQRPWAAFFATVGILFSALVPVSAVIVVLVQLKLIPMSDVLLGLIGTPIQQLLLIALTCLAARTYAAPASQVMALHAPVQGWKAYAISFAVFLVGVAIMGAAIAAIDPNANKEDLKAFQEMFRSAGWPIALLMVGVGAPLSEELLFRGFLFPAVARTRLGLLGATLITSGIWAAIHFYSPLGMLQVFVIGLLFSWILVRTGSLRVTIFCHALYNTTLGLLMMAGADGWM